MNLAGAGVTKLLGSGIVNPTQLGFPAELTSAFDADDGYSWKRLAPEGAAAGDPASGVLQETGDGAFTAGNDESLEPGQPGWMEPLAGGAGYLFVPEASGSSGDEFGFFYDASGYVITADTSWEDITSASGYSQITLPSAGTYEVYGNIGFTWASSTTGDGAMGARLLDQTLSSIVAGSYLFTAAPTTAFITRYVILSFKIQYTVTSATVIQWQAIRTGRTAGTWSTSVVGGAAGGFANNGHFLGWRRMLDAGGSGPPGPQGEQGETGPAGADGADGANTPDDANAVIGSSIFGG